MKLEFRLLRAQHMEKLKGCYALYKELSMFQTRLEQECGRETTNRGRERYDRTIESITAVRTFVWARFVQLMAPYLQDGGIGLVSVDAASPPQSQGDRDMMDFAVAYVTASATSASAAATASIDWSGLLERILGSTSGVFTESLINLWVMAISASWFSWSKVGQKSLKPVDAQDDLAARVAKRGLKQILDQQFGEFKDNSAGTSGSDEHSAGTSGSSHTDNGMSTDRKGKSKVSEQS